MYYTLYRSGDGQRGPGGGEGGRKYSTFNAAKSEKLIQTVERQMRRPKDKKILTHSESSQLEPGPGNYFEVFFIFLRPSRQIQGLYSTLDKEVSIHVLLSSFDHSTLYVN